MIHKNIAHLIIMSLNTRDCCFIGNNKYSIDDFCNDDELVEKYYNKQITIYDENNNELVFCNGEKVIPYFRRYYNTNSTMGKWHTGWQKLFDGYTEITYKNEQMHKKCRRTDVDLNDNQVVEFQHSRIEHKNVKERMEDYEKVGKKVIWVIDGNPTENNAIIVTRLNENNRIFLEFDDKGKWKYESFIDYEKIYMDIDNEIYEIVPADIKSKMIDVQAPISKTEFCNKLKNGEEIFKPCEIIQTTIYVRQLGAGNGKTFSATNLLSESYNGNGTNFHHYKTFLYLTKQHSAKTVTYCEIIKTANGKNELKSEHLAKDFELISSPPPIDAKNNDGKYAETKYHITLKHKRTGEMYKIIVATIDSFIYALVSEKPEGLDKFASMVNKIIDDEFKCSKNGHNNFGGKGGVYFNKQMLIVGDEMQDLEENYVKAILKVCRERYVDFYIVGDKLQSITNEHNSFTFLATAEFPPTMRLERPNAENKIRRFGGDLLINFVNRLIPFNKYNLPPVTLHPEMKDNDFSNTDVQIFEGNTIYANTDDKCAIDVEVEKIMELYRAEVIDFDRKPEDFLIITPFTKANPLVDELNSSIRDFWIKRRGICEYTKYSYFHKSENGCAIDLRDSINATRIVSIHTSKGDGRDVVFVIGLNEDALKKFSDESNNLVYDSLLHVALTRMKQRLYIRRENNNDDISRKLSYLETDVSLSPYINFTKTNKLEDLLNRVVSNSTEIYKRCQKHIIEHTEYSTFPDENKFNSNKQIIDLKHHIVRRVTMNILFHLAIANKVILDNSGKNKNDDDFLRQQTFVLLKNCHKSENKIHQSVKNYRKQLYDDTCNKITLLEYTYGEYKTISRKVIETVNANKIILKNLVCSEMPINIEDMDVIRSICLFHTMEVRDHKFKSILPISDLFDIINIFMKSNETQQNDYIASHYLKAEKINDIYNKIATSYPNLQWLWQQTVYFKGNIEDECIEIKHKYEYIAYNSTHVIICKICPQFNSLNFNKIIFDSIFEIFILKNCRDGKDCNNNTKNNFINKKILVCIITLDLNEPYYIDFNDLIDNNRKCILCMLKHILVSTFSVKNKGIYLLYKFYFNKYKEFDSHEIIKKIRVEVSNVNKIKELPGYVTAYFKKISSEVTDLDEDDYSVLHQYNDNDYFMKQINIEMNKSINDYLDISKTDEKAFINSI